VYGLCNPSLPLPLCPSRAGEPSRTLFSSCLTQIISKPGHSLPEVGWHQLKNPSVVHGSPIKHSIAMLAFKNPAHVRRIRLFLRFLCGEIG